MRKVFGMTARSWDIITVGGWVAASALAKVMAERGARALCSSEKSNLKTACAQRRSFHACHTLEGWIRALFQDPSPEAAALRARALPLIAEDPTRVPDHIFSGPDLPLSEQVRARFFGEC